MKKYIFYLIAIFFVLNSFFQAQQFHGVFAGVNYYPNPLNDLSDCVNDAISVKSHFVTYKNWPSGDCTLLTNSAASETGVMNSINSLPKGSNYIGTFSFAGHGDSEELGNLYGTPGLDGITPSGTVYGRITPSELENKFGTSYNQYMCLIDACGSGIFPRDMSHGVISSACEADELAGEDYYNHGYYSYFIIQGLAQSTIITAEALHNYAAPRVTNANSNMHPQLGDNYSGNLNIKRNIIPPTPTISLSGDWGDNPVISFSGGGAYLDYYVLKKEYDFGSGFGSPSYIAPASSPYTDINVERDKFGDLVARYSVKAVDEFGVSSAYSSYVSTLGQSLWKENQEVDELLAITEYELNQNYPNPFNPTTQISYQIPKDGFVKLVLYNSLGEEVSQLVNDFKSIGKYSVQFNASNLPSGVYIYKITADNFTSAKKMLLTK